MDKLAGVTAIIGGLVLLVAWFHLRKQRNNWKRERIKPMDVGYYTFDFLVLYVLVYGIMIPFRGIMFLITGDLQELVLVISFAIGALSSLVLFVLVNYVFGAQSMKVSRLMSHTLLTSKHPNLWATAFLINMVAVMFTFLFLPQLIVMKFLGVA